MAIAGIIAPRTQKGSNFSLQQQHRHPLHLLCMCSLPHYEQKGHHKMAATTLSGPLARHCQRHGGWRDSTFCMVKPSTKPLPALRRPARGTGNQNIWRQGHPIYGLNGHRGHHRTENSERKQFLAAAAASPSSAPPVHVLPSAL